MCHNVTFRFEWLHYLSSASQVCHYESVTAAGYSPSPLFTKHHVTLPSTRDFLPKIPCVGPPRKCKNSNDWMATCCDHHPTLSLGTAVVTLLKPLLVDRVSTRGLFRRVEAVTWSSIIYLCPQSSLQQPCGHCSGYDQERLIAWPMASRPSDPFSCDPAWLSEKIYQYVKEVTLFRDKEFRMECFALSNRVYSSCWFSSNIFW